MSSNVAKQLADNKIPFTTKRTMSNGFHGTVFLFPTRYAAVKAQKVTGLTWTRYNKEWQFTTY
jgi:hypothetical protein